MPAQPPIGLNTMSDSLKGADRYHLWLSNLVRPHLGKIILECGTGNGIMTKYLLKTEAEQVYSIDIDTACHEQFLMGCRDPRLKLDIFDLNSTDFVAAYKEQSVDTIILFNVLEHISNDVKLLENLQQILIPEGKLILFAPAFNSLFGGMDHSAGHYRRYTRKEIDIKLKASGYLPQKIEYVNPLGFFGWWFTNKVLGAKDLNSALVNDQIMLFDRYILPLSSMLQPLFSHLLGQSVFALSKRPQC